MYKYVQNLKRIAVYLSLLSDHLIFLQKMTYVSRGNNDLFPDSRRLQAESAPDPSRSRLLSGL